MPRHFQCTAPMPNTTVRIRSGSHRSAPPLPRYTYQDIHEPPLSTAGSEPKCNARTSSKWKYTKHVYPSHSTVWVGTKIHTVCWHMWLNQYKKFKVSVCLICPHQELIVRLSGVSHPCPKLLTPPATLNWRRLFLVSGFLRITRGALKILRERHVCLMIIKWRHMLSFSRKTWQATIGISCSKIAMTQPLACFIGIWWARLPKII